MKVCGLVLEEIANVAAIVEIVADAGFCVETKLWQDGVLYTQASPYGPLHAILVNHLVHSVGIDFSLDVPVGLSTCREISAQSVPLPKHELQIQATRIDIVFPDNLIKNKRKTRKCFVGREYFCIFAIEHRNGHGTLAEVA